MTFFLEFTVRWIQTHVKHLLDRCLKPLCITVIKDCEDRNINNKDKPLKEKKKNLTKNIKY